MIDIRRAAASDVDAVRACLAAAFAPYRDRYTPGAFDDTVPDRTGLAGRVDRMSVLVAQTADGRIVGTLACGAGAAAGEGHLRGMAVLPEYLGHGVAAALLSAAEAELRAAGCTYVTLDTTRPLQRAIRFYVKHGYAPTGMVADFHGMELCQYRKDL